MTLLSIIIPLYNQEKYIEKCITSIQNQSLEDISIIVVDDGSTDNSVSICERIAKNDNRISIIYQENRGLAGARYSGLRNCQTKYVTFVDADDFIIDDAYERALEYMKQDIDMVFFEISRFYSNNRISRESHTIPIGFYDRERIEKEIFDKLIWNLRDDHPGIECSQCVRITKKNLLMEQYDSISIGVYYGEDMAITYPLYTRLATMQVVSHSYYMHRQKDNNACESYIVSDGFFEEVFKLHNHLMSKFTGFGEDYQFIKQIEYLYIYNVQMKKKKYREEGREITYLYPFNKTLPGKRVLLYGAGNVGRSYYEQLNRLQYCRELLWVDLEAEYIGDNRVRSLDEIESFKADYAVIAIYDRDICKDVKNFLITKGIGERQIVF